MDTPDITTLIDNYTPSSLAAEEWGKVCEEVRAWVHAAAPGHPNRARQLLSAGAQLANWCRTSGIPVDVGTALRTTTIERYCAVAEADGRHSPSTRATIRARLRYLSGVHQIAGQPPPPPELRRGRVKPPYLESEIASYFLLIGGQPEPTATRLEALLLAGLGAGCGSEELRHLRGCDISRTADGIIVAHLQGRRERIIPVVDKHAQRLAELAERSGESLLIGGEKPDRRAVASRLLQRLQGREALPPLEPGRLRSTWVADRLVAGVRLDVLMEAAGLTTPTTIVDLAAFLPTVPESIARAQLRADRPSEPTVVRQVHTPTGAPLQDCPPRSAIDGRGA